MKRPDFGGIKDPAKEKAEHRELLILRIQTLKDVLGATYPNDDWSHRTNHRVTPNATISDLEAIILGEQGGLSDEKSKGTLDPETLVGYADKMATLRRQKSILNSFFDKKRLALEVLAELETKLAGLEKE
ncbi:MAG: hypothetical protein A3A33_03685 [Candidatus Yanofskybacteria bacterium RIFCSPLOWO2_01_FULL_49_25]|uniref:Uncharacterized protein n=1 Tax=Candidatus Yanofskybacteria bacterium RIFCSPLOWO2_01_FULL_49_25 TaxID=1802701 RepID=A0A1F8GV60_9BACT|nr:MAG: hypothetical protein A3A33_03685 [Candidatus Yanofskybacteria bacterium RIFCSPLOWO2_01_FULL_49_25]